jgi:hypothetical protein
LKDSFKIYQVFHSSNKWSDLAYKSKREPNCASSKIS